MKHPHKCRRGKHFTKGKYKNLLYLSDKKDYDVRSKKVRKTSVGRTKTLNEMYKIVAYKIKYNKVKVIKTIKVLDYMPEGTGEIFIPKIKKEGD